MVLCSFCDLEKFPYPLWASVFCLYNRWENGLRVMEVISAKSPVQCLGHCRCSLHWCLPLVGTLFAAAATITTAATTSSIIVKCWAMRSCISPQLLLTTLFEESPIIPTLQMRKHPKMVEWFFFLIQFRDGNVIFIKGQGSKLRCLLFEKMLCSPSTLTLTEWRVACLRWWTPRL